MNPKQLSMHAKPFFCHLTAENVSIMLFRCWIHLLLPFFLSFRGPVVVVVVGLPCVVVVVLLQG